jgi:tetracycline 7-halogenase / FADH2 O2-dependent halogenase
MKPVGADVVVLGSGFAGSLAALLIQRSGLQVALVDRWGHPRFAIGESSTPAADYVLQDLARTYDVPRLAPLAKYGTWQQTYPQLVCGLKRGFSYFLQQAGEEFRCRGDHGNELLVTASRNDAAGDTHWLRSDVDDFLVHLAQAQGVLFYDHTELTIGPGNNEWILEGNRKGQALRLSARFLIDATGEAAVLPRRLGILPDHARLATNSRALFAHFTHVEGWHQYLQQAGGTADHPFCCDDAAQHHLLDEGWMWQLRFNNGVTSAGFALDALQCPMPAGRTPEQEWAALVRRYPSLHQQFTHSQRVQPAGGLVRTARMQRLAGKFAGQNWVLLPHTAGFVDPLHSTGIAQSLCGIERLLQILRDHWGRASIGDALRQYEQTLRDEFALIDQLVSGGYQARRQARLFAAYAMLYFAAATTYERKRREGTLERGAAFLCADDPGFRRVATELKRDLDRLSRNQPGEAALSEFEQAACDALRPFNHVGLFAPAVPNMYYHTAEGRAGSERT